MIAGRGIIGCRNGRTGGGEARQPSRQSPAAQEQERTVEQDVVCIVNSESQSVSAPERSCSTRAQPAMRCIGLISRRLAPILVDNLKLLVRAHSTCAGGKARCQHGFVRNKLSHALCFEKM